MIELSITVKDEHSKLTEKDLIYDNLPLGKNNLFLIERVRAAVLKFGLDPATDSPDVIVKTKMVWQ